MPATLRHFGVNRPVTEHLARFNYSLGVHGASGLGKTQLHQVQYKNPGPLIDGLAFPRTWHAGHAADVIAAAAVRFFGRLVIIRRRPARFSPSFSLM